jgi:predicted  nucleic acid-binding Zn-ribbon protein
MTIAETPMQETLRTLWGIQEIDRDLFRVGEELKRLPAERAARERKLDELRAQIQAGKDEVTSVEDRVKEFENQAMTQRQKIRKLEDESESSRDMAFVEACRYEVRELQREIKRNERVCVEMLVASEEKGEGLKEFEERLTVEEGNFVELSDGIDREIADAEGRKATLESSRTERLGEGVNPDTLNLYNRLLGARDGQAMALVDSQVCQACYMSIPPNMNVQLARGTKVIQCPSCDRILYRN